ncbi:MAG: hypothetical protein JXB05_16780 [Myxococcaceae bacterium]|nr:hypothetical protein [Myxococcaceae bacterium]
MRVATVAHGRVAFLGAPDFEPHAPASADWAQVRFFAVRGGAWQAAAEEAREWGPDATVVFRPQDVSAEFAASLPGAMKLGIIPTPLFIEDEVRRLQLNTGADTGGFRWLTYLEWPPPPALARLPLLQSLPLPVDTARFAAGPRLERRGFLVPDWARPSPSALARMQAYAPIEVLPGDMPLAQVLERLAEAGVLLYSSRDVLGRFDALPMLAMAQGLLLISDSPFAPDWYIEPEDEFLLRPGDELIRAVDEFVRTPEAHKAVRIRAWQKLREAFDASGCFRRLLHDASLLASPREHLSRLAPPKVVSPAPEAAHDRSA